MRDSIAGPASGQSRGVCRKLTLARGFSGPCVDPNRLTPGHSDRFAQAWAGKSGCVSILTITAGSSMAAMILNSPPHRGQCSRHLLGWAPDEAWDGMLTGFDMRR